MAGIQLFQPNGAGILNAAGAQHPAPVEVEAGIICQLSFVGGTTAFYRWSLSKPASSSAVLSSATSAGPSFLPDTDDDAFSITLIDSDENVYILDIITPTSGGGGGGGGGGGVVTTVDTYDDLRNQLAFSGTPPGSLILQCREDVDDGGGGPFAFDSSDTTTADNDGTVLVDIDGNRFKRIFSGPVDPRWFGVKCDNSTNDAAAWAATMALFGATSRMRSGAVHVPNKTSAVASTIALTRYSGVFRGEGAGTSLGGTCAIRWAGSNSDPLIRLRRCWGTHVADLRLIGNASNPPSAAINLHTVNAEGSPHNTDISIENVWIGGISGEDTIISGGFANGITFTGVGDPVQNDQSVIRKCLVQDVSDAGIDIATAQATIIEVDSCKFNACTDGVKTVSRGLVVRNSFFSTITNCVHLAGDSGVTLENNGAEGCGRLLLADAGGGSGIFIRGEYFQVNQRTVDAGGAFIEVDCGGTAAWIVIDSLQVQSDGVMDPGEAKIKVTNCSHLILIARRVSWYDSLRTIDHLDIATTGASQTRLVVWEYEGKEYVNYWEHGAHANAQLGERVDFPVGATLPPDVTINTVDVAGLERSLLKFNSTGDFASYVEIGDSVTPIAAAGDVRARQANIDIRNFRNILDLLGYISWDASSMGGVKIIPNEGTPNGVVTAEPGSICQDYDNGGLWFKVTGSGNTGWLFVPTMQTTSIVRVLRGMPFIVEADADVNEYGEVVINTTAGTAVKWVIEAPDGCSLTGVELCVIGGGNGALPAVMPGFRVRTLRISNENQSSQGPFADASINTTQYNAIHSIEATLTPITIDNQDRRYTIDFFSESGANAATGYKVIGIYLTFTPASLDSGAA